MDHRHHQPQWMAPAHTEAHERLRMVAEELERAARNGHVRSALWPDAEQSPPHSQTGEERALMRDGARLAAQLLRRAADR